MNQANLLNHLSQYQPQKIEINTRFAAVSIVLNLGPQNPELFLIKRTSHPDDPWSGQIGLPGGHHEDIDPDLSATARRETREETGIVLTNDQLITQIDDQQGYATGGKINLTVRPFVFIVYSRPQVSINYELEHYYWLPIDYFMEKNNHLNFEPMAGFSQRPGVRLDDSNILWGMTYRIFTDFFRAAKINTPFIGDYDRSR